MAFQTGYNKSDERISSHELLLIDLPSKRLLGEGPAGIGYETEWEGKRCARKEFVGVPSSIFLKEAVKLVGLEDHKNIVKTYGWTIDKRSCSLVLEYMDDDLLGLLQKRKEWKRNLADIGSGTDDDPSHPKPFGFLEALNVIKEIADGVKQLHDKNIAHGDLKTRNILVNYANDLGDTNSWSVKVADFGLAQTKRKSISFVSRQARKLDTVQWKSPEHSRKLISLGKLEDNDETSSESGSNSDESASTRSGAGTDPLKSHDSFAADVYSFAVTCSQILTGEDPYPNLNWKELVDEILNLGLTPKLLDACPPSLKELLQSCWDKEPSGRPPFSDIQRRLQVILGGVYVITREEMGAEPRKAVVHLEAAEEIQTALEPLSVSRSNKRILNFGEESNSSDANVDYIRKAMEPREKLEELDEVKKGVITDMFENKLTVKATTEPETVLEQAEKDHRQAHMQGKSKFHQAVLPRLGNDQQKYGIFLSHSGAQKAFVRRVWHSLKSNGYCPISEEDPNSLPKGEPFAHRILTAARLADVAVVVLSDEFLISKWPMFELAFFIREQRRREILRDCEELKILPLFITEEFQNTQRQTYWKNKWNEMRVRDDRIDVSEWEEALKVLGGTNGLEYCRYKNEEEYIDSIMSAISKLVTPDLRLEDSHMKGKSKFHEAVAEMFARSPPKTRFHNVRAIGLYGVGGIGKTTLCKSLCNEYHARFNGKVWHAELGKKSAEEIEKDVLRHLVGTSEELLSQLVKGKWQRRSLLRKKIEFKVFLAIDNVWNEDEYREQAEALLEMGYHPDSLVIVASRSRELLEWLGIHKECCFEMPVLDKSDAREVLLQSAAPGFDTGCLEDYQRTAVETVVERCFMTKGPISSAGSEKQYVPLALKVLGGQLRLPLLQDNPEMLKAWLGKLDLKWPDQKEHPIFSVLRLSYDNLPSSKHKSIFIDVALCVPRQHDNTSASVTEVCKWLSMVHCERFDSILRILKDLERDGVVERWHDMSSPFGMHELYCEFAKTEVGEADELYQQRYLYHEDDHDMPALMLWVPLQKYWPLRRIHIYGGGFRELSNKELQYMVNVEVLKLEFCCELESLDVRCLKLVRSVELRGCFSLGMVRGLEHLKHLKYLRWNSCRKSMVVADFPQALEVVQIYGSKESKVVDIGCLGGCVGLVELTLRCHPMLAAISDLCKLHKLEKVDLSECSKVEEVQGLGGLRRLRHLILENCKRLRHCDGLEDLVEIETLNLSGCENLELPTVWDLSRLVMLRSINIGGIPVVRKLVLDSPHLEQLVIMGCRDLRIVTLCNDSGSWSFLNRLKKQTIEEITLETLF